MSTNKERLDHDFHEFIVEKNKPKTYGYGCYNSYNIDTSSSNTSSYDYCNISFYEWSKLEGNTPKIYKSVNKFFKFLDDCHIKYSVDDKLAFKTRYTAYASCIPGKSEIIITPTYQSLLNELNRYKVSE